MLIGTLIRIAVRLMLALTLTLLAWMGVTRAVEAPLPALLYANRTTLRARVPGCMTLIGPCVPLDRALIDGLDDVQPVSDWSPDGMFIAVRLAEGWQLYRAGCLLDGGTCSGTPLETGTETSLRVAWGPDASAIAYVIHGGDTLRVQLRGCWTDEPDACRRIDFDAPYTLSEVAWSPDGRYMAFAGAPHGVFLLDAGCLAAPKTCKLASVAADPNQYWWPSLARGGRRLLYTTYGDRIFQEVFLLDLLTGTRQDISTRRDEADGLQPAWDADERYVAFVSLDGLGDDANLNIYLYDMARGLTAPGVVQPGNDTFPTWAPPGQTIR